jgi:putative intracellular protease/amidase
MLNACKPIKEFSTTPPYTGKNDFSYQVAPYDSLKKNVVIVANNDATELFDMIAPYYLFNATEKADVYITAKHRYPIVTKKGVFVLPQATFSELDSMHIQPDVIVIPFLGVADSANQDIDILTWIKKHYSANVNILAICDGSATAAATGLYDGKPITAHAADFTTIKSSFAKPKWIQNVSITSHGNLYSSAGVSNATEGSLVVIEKVFGKEVMNRVMLDVDYPFTSPKIEHDSRNFKRSDKMAIAKKILFRKNKKVGVFIHNGVNEFYMAGIMDTYNRSFPFSIQSFSLDNKPVKTKFGLTLLPTGLINQSKLNELHVIDYDEPITALQKIKKRQVVRYKSTTDKYIIDQCLHRIRTMYGRNFQQSVKLMLDYN